jgi:cell division protein FtsN
MAIKRRSSKQSGGTVLGIVLGLIVGLAIAVVVALYITRAPTPFVAKVAPTATSDTTGGAQPQTDPNRILQGKSPGQPVPQAAQQTPPNTAPGQSSNQSQSSGMLDEPQIVEVPPASVLPGSSAPVKPSSTPNAASPQPAQPKPNQAPNQAATPSASSAPTQANTGYFLQVGAYKTAQDADQQRARLALQGFEGKVSQRDAGGVTYFRVRLGPFAKFDDMNNVRQRLSDAGVDTVVIRFTKQ